MVKIGLVLKGDIINGEFSHFKRSYYKIASINPIWSAITNYQRGIESKKEILSYWSDEEIKNIGKIGLSSKTFLLDNEDYSRW